MKVTAPRFVKAPADIEFLCAGFRARTELIIDLRDVEWISPLGVVAVLSSALSAQRRNLRVTVQAPIDQVSRTYLARIGFWAELDRQGWSADDDMDLDPGYEVQACVPVSPLTSEFEVELATNLLDGALSGVVAPNLTGPVFTVASELTQNAREHGSSCYMVVQTHTGATSGTPGVHVAVADFGDGFAHSLREVIGRVGDAEAIVRAFEDNISGTGLPDRGFGLGFVREQIDVHSDAALTIISRTATVTWQEGHFRADPGRVDFRGTLATAYFPYLGPGAI